MLLPHNVLIAVADGRAFHVLRNSGTEADPKLEAGTKPELTTVEAGGGGHHRSSSANPDQEQQGEDGHAASVVRWLNDEVLGGRAKSVVVVAPPRALGEMRRHYHAELKKVLVGEIDREMTTSSPTDLQAALAAA